MTFQVNLDDTVFPNLPDSSLFLPDHWVSLPDFESAHAVKVWGDPTFDLLEQIPLISVTVVDCERYLWEMMPEYIHAWSPLITEEVVTASGVETIIFQKHMLFINRTDKHNVVVTGIAPTIDPSRVWEVQDTMSGLSR